MFVLKLPEGARTASLVNASTQIGAVLDLIYFGLHFGPEFSNVFHVGYHANENECLRSMQ